jgi:hypothetical protein
MLAMKLSTQAEKEAQGQAAVGGRTSPWLWTCGVLLGLLFSTAAVAQTGAPGGPGSVPGTGFGTGATTPLQFAGQGELHDAITLSLGADALYDSNVLDTNRDRIGDEAVSFTSHLAVTRHTEHLRFNFDYNPFFEVYRQVDQYDRLNHAADLGLNYQLSERVWLGVHDTFSYQNGVYPGLTGYQYTTGPISPTSLNQMIYTPMQRTLANMTGLDLTFVKSRRTSVTLSGGYNQRKFGHQASGSQTYYNSQGFSGGVEYQYRATEHTSVGFVLSHQDTTYQGGEIFGSRLRSQVESALFSLQSRLAPTVTVTLFGGPQYLRTLGASSPGQSSVASWEGSAGGSIAKEVRKTALSLSVQRFTTDGGGLYTSVMSTSVLFGVRRQLVGRWEGSLHGGGAQADTSLLLLNGKAESLIGGIDLSRPVRGGSTFHISYDTMHQLTRGSLPSLNQFDRNQVTVGFDYQLKAIPLGR